jgi:hypothetical protein
VAGRAPELFGRDRLWTVPYFDAGKAAGDLLNLPKPAPDSETASQIVRGGLSTLYGAGAGAGLSAAAQAGSRAARVGEVLAAQPVRQTATALALGGAQQAMPADWSPELKGAITLGLGAGAGFLPGAHTGSMSPRDITLAQEAQARGIPIYPGQTMGKTGQMVFDVTGKSPLSGAEGAARTQQTAFNSAVGDTFGAAVDADGRLGPTSMSGARNGLSNMFQFVTSRAQPTVSTSLHNDLNAVEYNMARGLPQPDQGVAQNIADIRGFGQGNRIPTQWMMDQLKADSPMSVAARGSGDSARYYAQVLDALHDELQRTAQPGDIQLLQNARQGWKNMLTVERPVAQGNGDISANGLTNAVANNPFQRKAYTGGGDLGLLGEIGKRFIKPPPSSGTAERGAAYTGLTTMLTGAGITAAGNPMVGVPMMAGPPAIAGTMGLTNRLMRVGAMSTPPISRGEYYARLLANTPMTGATASQGAFQ